MGRTVQLPGNQHLHAPENDREHPAHGACMFSAEVEGLETEFLIQPFDDRIFIAITQVKKLGTMILAEMDMVAGGHQTFTVTVLVGKRDETMMDLCARRIMAEMVKDGCNKQLLLSMALKDHSMSLVPALVGKIVDRKVW